MTEKAQSVLRAVELLVLFLVSIFAVPACSKYDELVAKDQVVQQRWADVEAEQQRRADLIPNLVTTVKAAANYEQSTLTKIAEARASATSIKLSVDDLSDPAKMKAFEEAQAKISPTAMSRLLATNENYPKLQASTQYTDLMKSLESSENRVLRARQEYNAAVAAYNTVLLQIGGKVVNKATGQEFKPRVPFSGTEESKVAPKISPSSL